MGRESNKRKRGSKPETPSVFSVSNVQPINPPNTTADSDPCPRGRPKKRPNPEKPPPPLKRGAPPSAAEVELINPPNTTADDDHCPRGRPKKRPNRGKPPPPLKRRDPPSAVENSGELMDGVGAAVVPAMDAVKKPFREHTEQLLGGGWNNHQYDQERHSALVGLEDAEKELVARLLDDNEKSLRVISLVSEEPLGKTALARKVYNRLDIRQHFKRRVWVRVPKDFAYKGVTYRDLLIIILNQIGLPPSWASQRAPEELSATIYTILMKVRFLIVLDDVYTVDVRSMLTHPFANVLNGSRIILTTRDSNVASHDDLWSSRLNLMRLSDEGSWALFLKKVGRPQNSSDINSFREDILRICHGLSPAIMLLGGVLSTMESSEWSRVIDLVVAAHFGKGQLPLSNFADLSYQMLPDVLKPCILNFALYPEAYEIPIRYLLHNWIGERLVQVSTETSFSFYLDVAKKYLEELVRRNLVEIVRWKPDGTPETCHVPCYVYDVLSRVIKFDFLHHGQSDCTSADSLEFNADQVHIECTSNLTSNSLIKFLQPSVSFNTRINAGGFSMLKKLDLEGVYKPVLPEKLGIMVNLRYLNLRWTYLDSFSPFIGDLPCLEILDLKHTHITILPCSIWKANNLRYLYMNDVTIQKPSNQPPTNLEVLTGLSIGSKDPGIYGLDRCTSLRKLVLTCHSESALKTAECISRLGNLHTLKLRSIDLLSQPSNLVLSPLEDHPSLSKISLLGVIKDHRIGNLPRNLNTLTLSMSRLTEDPMRVLGKLPQLRMLKLLARSYLGQEMTCHADQNFPELIVLKLWNLEKLELLTVENGAMPKLRELEITDCKKLRSSEGLDQLRALKELILKNMSQDFVEDARRSCNEKVLIEDGNSVTLPWD